MFIVPSSGASTNLYCFFLTMNVPRTYIGYFIIAYSLARSLCVFVLSITSKLKAWGLRTRHSEELQQVEYLELPS
jgi:hypothetical protein